MLSFDERDGDTAQANRLHVDHMRSYSGSLSMREERERDARAAQSRPRPRPRGAPLPLPDGGP